MSKTYEDLINTIFPDSVDDLDYVNDISDSTYELMVEYNALIAEKKFEDAATLRAKNPLLEKCIINADKINKMQEQIAAMQRYEKSDTKFMKKVEEVEGNLSKSTNNIYEHLDHYSSELQEAKEQYSSLGKRLEELANIQPNIRCVTGQFMVTDYPGGVGSITGSIPINGVLHNEGHILRAMIIYNKQYGNLEDITRYVWLSDNEIIVSYESDFPENVMWNYVKVECIVYIP